MEVPLALATPMFKIDQDVRLVFGIVDDIFKLYISVKEVPLM
jgi:hypothetical protein